MAGVKSTEVSVSSRTVSVHFDNAGTRAESLCFVKELLAAPEEVAISLDGSDSIDVGVAASLEAALHLRSKRGLRSRLTRVTPQQRERLRESGLLSRFTGDPGDQSISVPLKTFVYDVFAPNVSEAIGNYLDRKWLRLDWARIEGDLRDELISTVLELYGNAFEHGSSPNGVTSCGCYGVGNSELVLAVVDLGVGIGSTVNGYFKRQGRAVVSDDDAINWALERGNTSRPTHPRGLGFHFLRTFLGEHGGQLDVVSGRGRVSIGFRGGESICVSTEHQVAFPGTMVKIALRFDNCCGEV